MNHLVLKSIITFLLITIFCGCNTNPGSLPLILKAQTGDPFSGTMVASQEFDIDGQKDTVVEGKKGTVMVFPKGCFLNADGSTADGHIKIELAEGLSLEDMLLANLTTQTDGKPLITDGMIYFNAMKDGKQLKVNKAIPVHIEIPTTHKQPGMMAWKGTRDTAGNMNWTDPKEIDKYLVHVDLSNLDFLPEGFAEQTALLMPYKNHKTATKELTDSLYYTLSVSDGSELVKGLVETNYNEPYYNKNKKVVNGKYTPDSYKVNETDSTLRDTVSLQLTDRGIDPAIIKVIRSEKYEHTLIATREFETRLRAIFRTCHNATLEIYIKHLDKNLYELDSMAAMAEKAYGGMAGDHGYEAFYAFSQERLTKVKDADKYAAQLSGYYEQRLSKIKTELEDAKEKMMQALDKKNAEAQKLVDDYEALLFKRESWRMETYGFEWTETGWINIDNGTLPKTWGPEPLEATVVNGNAYDRVYVYAVYENIKSIYRLNTDDDTLFYAGNKAQREMLMPKGIPANIFAIGYKGNTQAIAITGFSTGIDTKVSLTLKASTPAQVKKIIAGYNRGYVEENQISVDLKYMEKFYKEQQRQKALIKESEMFRILWGVAHPCCNTTDTTRKEM